MKTLDHKAALELRFDSDAGEDITLRDYFFALLKTLWEEGEGFSGKRPFGNSGWEREVYMPLIAAGYIDGTLDIDGYIASYDRKQAASVVPELIHFAIYNRPLTP